MIAVSRSLTASEVSIVTVEAALSNEFGENPPLPRWSPSLLPAANDAAAAHEAALNEAAARPVVDRLVMGMAGAGHSVETLSLYLGLEESEVRERVAALDLPAAPEKPLRRWSSKNLNPWSVEEVRRLIALWLDNVSVSSIAGALGRTATSIHGKRRWLGLGVRVRKDLADRPASQCRKIRLPWNADKLDIGRILIRLYAPKGAANVAEIKWELGHDAEKDHWFSKRAFAGLPSSSLSKQMLRKFGVYLTESAVDNRVSRLQVARDRRDLIYVLSDEEIEVRAKAAKDKVGAKWRRCVETGRWFWYCPDAQRPKRSDDDDEIIRRSTTREFNRSPRYASRRAARSCGETYGMAA
jgi:hypothetical protein